LYSTAQRTVAGAALICAFGGPWISAAQALTPAQKERLYGAVVAPATLPEGTASAYVYGGVPEAAVGYRQGVSTRIELEARFKLNYYLVSVAVEVLLKHTIASNDALALAPFLGVGFVHDTGSRWVTQTNFQYTGIRTLAGLIGTLRLGDVATAVGELDLPLDLSLRPTHGTRFAPLAGGGFELKLTSEVTTLLMGQIGFIYSKEPLGVPQWDLGYQVKFGLGFRLF
jgi:hypothetical protein